MLSGTGASPGIALGKVLIIENQPLRIEKTMIQDIEAENKRFEEALDKSIEQLEEIKERANHELGEDKGAIFEAHQLILQDPELIKQTRQKIDKEQLNAEYAFKEVVDKFVMTFEAMDNEYMKERAADIKDVSERVLRNLTGQQIIDLSSLEDEVILVAEDLTPSDTATMDKEKVIGFLTNVGGRTSHSAIMARTLEIPAVVGLSNITEQVNSGEQVAFNGETGEVIVNPASQELERYQRLKAEYEQNKRELEELKGQESITLDGRKVELAGNIGTPDDIKGLEEHDAEGVGLYRTEFLYMNRETMPTEEEQFQAYKKVLESLNPKPIVIRTLDIGGDKKLPYLDIDEEMNPFLGYRAIRLCLDQQEIFKTQLKALLRASIYGNLKIMFPMISSLEELLEAKQLLEEVKQELASQDIEYSDQIEVGMMIEVPAAVLISDILAKHVDFFSIGTNDLIQYTCAVGRMNENVRYLYNPFHPGVLRLIKMTIDNGHKEGIWVGMCGEMAGDKRMIPILLGMGLDEFSMSPTSILSARKLVRSLKVEEMEQFADEVLTMGTADEIEEYIDIKFR